MKERSNLSDMLPFHFQVFFVVRAVGSLGPAVLFHLSAVVSLILYLHHCGCCGSVTAVSRLIVPLRNEVTSLW